MRQKRAIKHGRIVSLVIVGGVGYALGGWNAVTMRATDISASQTVALRFPQDLEDAVDATRLAVKRLAVNRIATDRFTGTAPAASQSSATHVGAANAAVIGASQVGLLSPNPMIQPIMAQTSAETAASPAAAVQARVQLASAAADVSLPQAAAVVAAPVQTSVVKPVAAAPAAARHRAEQRQGFVLNDAQISSIKTRLHLSPDQEQMWPAVEAALRNIAYARAREARRPGAPQNAAQVAAADPNSAEVQGLKSAAIPLLMSFNDDQKDQVRNLAHVMGLDQLASQF